MTIACELWRQPDDDDDVLSFGFGLCAEHVDWCSDILGVAGVIILRGRQTALMCQFCWLLETRHWLLETRHWLLETRH